MVDPLSYFMFQPVLHDWCNKGCGGLRCSSVVREFAHGTIDHWIYLHGGPIELFHVSASAPQLI